ncbi:DUF2939 domain-containing protein [Kangiella shandongensis]|uniref:DUF2939 domain-containing protein n=1 Tax=Kangiella shandongensis TaxID=2763258 RepID=UPI001CBE9B51|nr:DUF2939 domain-containing protein [Kangiella shandongensis]
MKKIIIGILLLIIFGVIVYPYYLAGAFKEKVANAETADELLQLVDEEALKQSIATSLKAAMQEQVKKDPMAGMAMAFLEPMTKMISEMALSPEGLQALLKGKSIKQIQQKAKAIEEDTWQWAYFTGFNRFRVVTKEVDFNFERQSGNWILKTVALKADEEQRSAKKSETTTKIYQSDGSIKEVEDSDKYGKAKYHQTKISFEQANDKTFLKNYLKKHFFVYAIFNERLVIQNDFEQLPFNVGYKVDWNKVIGSDGKDLLKSELTDKEEKNLKEQSEEFQGLRFGGWQSEAYIKTGVKEDQLALVQGNVTFSYPAGWKRFEFELSEDGESQTDDQVSFTVTQVSKQRIKIDYSYPTKYHQYEAIIMAFDDEGKRLEVDSKGGMSMKGQQQVNGKKDAVFYGKAESIVLLFPTKYEQFTETVHANLEPKAESIELLGKVDVDRYFDNSFNEPAFRDFEEGEFKELVEISAYRKSDERQFNYPALKLKAEEIANSRYASYDEIELKALKSGVPVDSVRFTPHRHRKGFNFYADTKDREQKLPLDIDMFKGRIVIDYPVTIETRRYHSGEAVPGVIWFPSALSHNKKLKKEWLRLRGYNKEGMRLAEVSNALPHNWDSEEYVFWGDLAYIEVDTVSEWDKVTFEIEQEVPELLDEKCKESSDC